MMRNCADETQAVPMDKISIAMSAVFRSLPWAGFCKLFSVSLVEEIRYFRAGARLMRPSRHNFEFSR